MEDSLPSVAPSLLMPEAAETAEPPTSSKKGGYLFEANPSLKCSFRDTKMSVYLFCVFAARLFVIPLWTIENIPILSPVYWQGHHWIASPERTAAILLHIGFGVVMLCAGMHQLQRSVDPTTDDLALVELFRSKIATRARRYVKYHKLVGRVYVLSGLVVLISLQVLLPTMGQGVSEGPSYLLIALMETCTILWVVTVFVAIVCIWRRQTELHRRLMRLSYAVALTPMTQRFVHVAMVPISLIVMWFVAAVQGKSTWADSLDDVWSMEGYGRADEAMLPFSAWTGLSLNCFLLFMDDHNKRQQTTKVGIEEQNTSSLNVENTNNAN